MSSIELEYENLEYQLEEAGDLELDDNLWDGQTIPDSSDLDPFEKTATKFELVIENINDLSTALQTPFQKVDDSEHRLEVGNSKKHRVGGWKPDLTGFGEFMAYGLFRNSAAVSAKSRVNSTSIVLVKEWFNRETGNKPEVSLVTEKRMTLTT